MNKMILFGAGKIGRSFIGQLFARSGFEVVFVDLFRPVIDCLNERHAYDVVIKSEEGDSVIHVGNVRGVLVSDVVKVAEEISDCDIIAVSVGQKGLPHIVPSIARGLELRMKGYGQRPVDIILAENMRNAAAYVHGLLAANLPAGFPVAEMTGLIETSIGKMVPITPADIQESDPLSVCAEPYNTLIVDKKGFKNPIPAVDGLAPKENIKAWVDRKSYIHNFGHAAAAYTGYRRYPHAKYMYELLDDTAIRSATREAMLDSAGVLMRKYPVEFTAEGLTEHIDDLISRFRNRALGDTVYRVGCDLQRKLFKTDRVLSPLLDAVAFGMPVDSIAGVFTSGLGFRATDESGAMFPDDAVFAEKLDNEGLDFVLQNICGLDYALDVDFQAAQAIKSRIEPLL